MPEPAQKCPNCGVDLVPKPEDGSCSACGVDPFLAEVQGTKKAVVASLKDAVNDVHKFVEELAVMLREGFAEQTEIKTSGIFSKHISEIVVTLEQHVYRLVIHGNHATAHRTRNVHGIKLKDEKLALPQWLDDLSGELSAIAAENQQAKDALSKFVGK
jgi:hypothetical protein